MVTDRRALLARMIADGRKRRARAAYWPNRLAEGQKALALRLPSNDMDAAPRAPSNDAAPADVVA